MKKLKNNKGVAFVTVLISITFITILAVSLLYMAYLNYLTKSMRTRSNDNFYTGEFGVDEVAACLQQKAANVKSSGGGIDDAKKAIKNAVGGTVDTGTGKYDPAKVTSLISVANTDGSTIVVSSDNPEYVVKANQVQLKNLRFDTTDPSGFTSTIYTDMSVQFQSTPPGDFDINDFSVISDSFVALTTDGGTGYGSVNYSGCVYLRDSGKGYALQNDKRVLVSLLSPVGILDGDLVIKNKPSAVSIAGDIMVRGNVIVEDGCSLAVSGTLKISGKLDAKSGSRIVGSSHISQGVNMDALPKEGLASEVFAKHLYTFYFVNDNGTKPKIIDIADILSEKPSWTPEEGKIADVCKYKQDGNTYVYPIVFFTQGGGATRICETNQTSIFDSTKKYIAMLNCPKDKLNASQVPGGGLVMTHRNIGYEGTIREVTMLTLGDILAYNDGDVSMTKMSKEGYKASKEALFAATSSYKISDGAKTSGSVQIGETSVNFQGGDFREFCEAICSGDWVVYRYNVDSGVIENQPCNGVALPGKTIESMKKDMEKEVYKTDKDGKVLDVDGNVWEASSGKEKAIAISTDGETRYLVFKAGKDGDKNSLFKESKKVATESASITQMLPYGYFLASNTSAKVSKYVSSTSPAEDPDVTTVRYDNWYKE